jgi:ankyrin repeat protein
MDLIHLIKNKKDIKLIKEAINITTDINSKDNDLRITPMYCALVYNKSFEVIKFLLEKGAGVHAYDTCEYTPLFDALDTKNSFEVIKLLIESGSDVNFTNIANYTPLIHAILCHSSFKIIKLLIENGADVNYVDPYEDHETPLIYACREDTDDSFEIIKLLLENGADVNYESGRGKTALISAIESRKPLKVILLLFSYGYILKKSSYEQIKNLL